MMITKRIKYKKLQKKKYEWDYYNKTNYIRVTYPFRTDSTDMSKIRVEEEEETIDCFLFICAKIGKSVNR